MNNNKNTTKTHDSAFLVIDPQTSQYWNILNRLNSMNGLLLFPYFIVENIVCVCVCVCV